MKAAFTRRSKEIRPRSLPSSRPFTVGVFFATVHYVSALGTLTAFILAIKQPSQLAANLIIGGLILSAVTWFIAFFKRRSAHCPLCKGTPLINSGALVHSKATRIFPLNHGVSSIFSIIATQRFRCMYCGSDFDLLKHASYRPGEAEANSPK